jgi:hypothetical protein
MWKDYKPYCSNRSIKYYKVQPGLDKKNKVLQEIHLWFIHVHTSYTVTVHN